MGKLRWFILMSLCVTNTACSEKSNTLQVDTNLKRDYPGHWAARNGQLQPLEKLLQKKSALEAKDPLERTPLFHAVATGQDQAVALLLKAGANVGAKSRYDMQPLHWAALLGQNHSATLLVDAGADLDARNLYGMTPLHMAQTPAIAQLLVERGAALNSKDIRGMTPLHFAELEAVAKLLIDRGASINIKDRQGLTPIDMTGVEHCGAARLSIYPGRDLVRMKGSNTQLKLIVWNKTEDHLSELTLEAQCDAADITVQPATIATFYPAQMTTYFVEFTRKTSAKAGKYPLRLTFKSQGEVLSECGLKLDTRPEETPEDRGMIPVGTVKLRTQPMWTQYLAYAAVPLLVVILWFIFRRRTKA